MQIFETNDSNTFFYNGRKYVKNFIVQRIGDTHISVYNAYDIRLQLVPATHYSEVQLDGIIHSSQAALMSALSLTTFSKVVGAGDSTQNNKVAYQTMGMLPGVGDITVDEVAAWLNGQEFALFIGETITPVLLDFIRTQEAVTKKYIFIFTQGKGMWGAAQGANPNAVYPSFFKLIGVQILTAQDVENDENAQINYLGEVEDGDFISLANESTWQFTGSTTQYYFTYEKDNILNFALFVGANGVYGLGATAFVQSDFVITTNNEVQPVIVPSYDQVLTQGNVSGTAAVHTDSNGGKTEYHGNGRGYNKGSFTQKEVWAEPIANVIITYPAKASNDTVAMTSDVNEAISATTQDLQSVLNIGSTAGITQPFNVSYIGGSGGSNLNLTDNFNWGGSGTLNLNPSGGQFSLGNNQGLIQAGSGGQISFDSTNGISLVSNSGGITLNGSAQGVAINGQGGGISASTGSNLFTHNGSKVLTSADTAVAFGIATLDSGGKVPASQLPNSVMTLEGQWNAATNTPTLSNGTGNAGMVYECTVSGTTNFGGGNITFRVGDWAVYGADNIWYRSLNSNEVTSVNGMTGAVIISSTTQDLQSVLNQGSTASTGNVIISAGQINFGGGQFNINNMPAKFTGLVTLNRIEDLDGTLAPNGIIIKNASDSNRISFTSPSGFTFYSNSGSLGIQNFGALTQQGNATFYGGDNVFQTNMVRYAGNTPIISGSQLVHKIYVDNAISSAVSAATSGNTAAWGNITGTLSAQTDLQTAVDGRLLKSGDTITGDILFSPTNTINLGTTINRPDNIYVNNMRPVTIRPINSTQSIVYRNGGGAVSGVMFAGSGNWIIGSGSTDGGYKLDVQGTGKIGGKLTVTDDIEVSGTTKGIILAAPNGSKYKISVDNSGNLTTTLI